MLTSDLFSIVSCFLTKGEGILSSWRGIESFNWDWDSKEKGLSPGNPTLSFEPFFNKNDYSSIKFRMRLNCPT